jgi:hypothetical protein
MSASKYIVIVAIFVTVLAALAVIARLVSRLVVLKNGGRDDVAISLSLVSPSIHHESIVSAC